MRGRRMKIVIYVGELDVKGGTHKQVLRLAQHLMSQGHELKILTPTFVLAETYTEFAEIPVVALAKEGTSNKRWWSRVRYKLAPIRLAMTMGHTDIVNIHDNRGVLFFILVWILRRAQFSVWQINDLHPAFKVGVFNDALSKNLKDRIHVILNRWMARHVDAITVNVGKNVERVALHMGVSAQLIHCGVDLPNNPPAPIPPVRQPFRVLSTGVFFPYRNYETLVTACLSAQSALGRAIQLTIVGDTRYNPAYVKAIREQADRDGVALRIRENLSQEELDNEIAESHVFAFVNVDQSWGLAVFEAAARGKPIVLSDSVGACELLAGHPGFELVNARSSDSVSRSIVKLLQAPAECVALARQAQRHVQSMSWGTMYCSPVETLFSRLLLSRS